MTLRSGLRGMIRRPGFRGLTRVRVLDLCLALLTTIGLCTGLAAVGAPLGWEGPVSLALFLGGVLLVRRRWPITVLLLSAAAVIAYQGAGLFEGGWIWPLSPALFSAATLASFPAASAIGAVVLAYGTAVQWAGPSAALARGGVELLWLALLLAGASAWRQYRRWQEEHDARLVQLEETRLAEQRLQISREVHDVVAHTLAVVGVHLNVAADALDEAPGEARDALRTAMEVRGRAMKDLRAFIGELRDEPLPDLASMEELLDRARSAGLAVTYDLSGPVAAVPAAQSLAAYRIVQEAITNTLKHSDARRLIVRLSAGPSLVRVEVADDGAGPVVFHEGHGLTGMRERVSALGGTLRLESGDGFAVRAALPVAGSGA